MRWTVHLEGGPQHVNHAAAAYGNLIFSFGGYCSSDEHDFVGKIDVHVLNTDTLRWHAVNYKADEDKAIPFKCYGHTVVEYRGKMYLWGGRNDTVSSDVLYCFDVSTRKWSLPQVYGMIPRAADGHTACVIGHYMYVFSGYEEASETYGNIVHQLDLISFLWTDIRTKGPCPNSRDFHTASAIGNYMYIFGGRGCLDVDNGMEEEFYPNNLVYLDTSTMTWIYPNAGGEIPPGRRSHSAVVYKNELYIMYGYNSVVREYYSDVVKYSPETNCWTKLYPGGRGPIPRRRQCCCLVGDMIYLFGGTSPCDEKLYITGRATHFTESQRLLDHSDLHVLDFFPSLKKLCLLSIIKWQIDCIWLPEVLRHEIFCMTVDNAIGKPYDNPRHDFGYYATSA